MVISQYAQEHLRDSAIYIFRYSGSDGLCKTCVRYSHSLMCVYLQDFLMLLSLLLNYGNVTLLFYLFNNGVRFGF